MSVKQVKNILNLNVLFFRIPQTVVTLAPWRKELVFNSNTSRAKRCKSLDITLGLFETLIAIGNGIHNLLLLDNL